MGFYDDLNALYKRFASGPTGAYLQKKRDEEEGRDYSQVAADLGDAMMTGLNDGASLAAKGAVTAANAGADYLGRGPMPEDEAKIRRGSSFFSWDPTSGLKPDATEDAPKDPSTSAKTAEATPRDATVNVDKLISDAQRQNEATAERASRIQDFLARVNDPPPALLEGDLDTPETAGKDVNLESYRELGQLMSEVKSGLDARAKEREANTVVQPGRQTAPEKTEVSPRVIAAAEQTAKAPKPSLLENIRDTISSGVERARNFIEGQGQRSSPAKEPRPLGENQGYEPTRRESDGTITKGVLIGGRSGKKLYDYSQEARDRDEAAKARTLALMKDPRTIPRRSTQPQYSAAQAPEDARTAAYRRQGAGRGTGMAVQFRPPPKEKEDEERQRQRRYT